VSAKYFWYKYDGYNVAKIEVNFMFIKEETGYFAKNRGVSRKISNLELIYDEIPVEYIRHIHTKKSHRDTKENTLRIADNSG